MNRTLENFIKEKRYKGYNFKIGSKSGTSFWLCKKNYNGLSNDIRLEYEKYCDKNEKALAELIERLEKLDDIYEERIAERLKSGIKNEQQYRAKQDRLKELERKHIPNKIEQIKKDMQTPFLKRQVKEIYRGICPDEQPCLIVYITGRERGDYWTIKDYEKKHCSKD